MAPPTRWYHLSHDNSHRGSLLLLLFLLLLLSSPPGLIRPWNSSLRTTLEADTTHQTPPPRPLVSAQATHKPIHAHARAPNSVPGVTCLHSAHAYRMCIAQCAIRISQRRLVRLIPIESRLLIGWLPIITQWSHVILLQAWLRSLITSAFILIILM